MIQKAMMNLLIKAMKTVLPEQSTSNSSSQNAKQIDIHNITDRATLEAVINNNYSEIDKIAYNSAVANGVIPQGNVMEGPASEAYASSLRVESGQEKSVYDQSNQSSEEENIDDPNAEINAQLMRMNT